MMTMRPLAVRQAVMNYKAPPARKSRKKKNDKELSDEQETNLDDGDDDRNSVHAKIRVRRAWDIKEIEIKALAKATPITANPLRFTSPRTGGPD
jgi:hypothetical protein